MSIVQSLREVADFLESNSHLKGNICASSVYIFCDEPQQLAQWAAAFGTFRKSADEHYLNVNRDFGMIQVQATIKHEMACEKIVEKKIIAAKPERTLPAEPEREEEVVKWHCPDSILSLASKEVIAAKHAEDSILAPELPDEPAGSAVLESIEAAVKD